MPRTIASVEKKRITTPNTVRDKLTEVPVIYNQLNHNNKQLNRSFSRKVSYFMLRWKDECQKYADEKKRATILGMKLRKIRKEINGTKNDRNPTKKKKLFFFDLCAWCAATVWANISEERCQSGGITKQKISLMDKRSGRKTRTESDKQKMQQLWSNRNAKVLNVFVLYFGEGMSVFV